MELGFFLWGVSLVCAYYYGRFAAFRDMDKWNRGR